MIEQKSLVPHQWDIETGVVGAGFGAAGFSGTQRLIPLRAIAAYEPGEGGNIMKNTWRADPLVWGHGPRVLEMFLEPTCPFSVKAFGKLDDLLGQAGEDQITIKLRLQSQPWHMYSGVIVRCILAASTLECGKAAAKSVMAAVAAHREEFEFDLRRAES